MAPCTNEKVHEMLVTTGQANSPAFPARWFTTYSALSPAIGLFVTVPAQREALSRVRASVEALRPHGFVVRNVMRSSRASHASTASRAQRSWRSRSAPLYRARDARRDASDLPVVTSEAPATCWHAGQITMRARNPVK